MIRQFDTGVGLVVGGFAGWFHHDWKIWSTLFFVLILWDLQERRDSNQSGGKSK